jgi:hypothetical protein
MKKLTLDDFVKLRKLVYRSARPLEFTMWKFVFENGSAEDFLDVISAYQNDDGGFGYNIEANLWNPNSSPEITSYTLSQIERAGCDLPDNNHLIVKGVLEYLASGKYLTESGWLCGLPSNLNYSHAPWFGYDPQNEIFRILDPLVDFILKYAERNSEIYQKAILLKAKHKPNEQSSKPDFSNYDPTKYEPWGLLPTNFVKSLDSEYYPIYKDFVEMELDGIVDRLHNTNEPPVMSFKDAWEDVRQIIGNYYWASSDYISQIEILKKFGRLDFQIPVKK